MSQPNHYILFWEKEKAVREEEGKGRQREGEEEEEEGGKLFAKYKDQVSISGLSIIQLKLSAKYKTPWPNSHNLKNRVRIR